LKPPRNKKASWETR